MPTNPSSGRTGAAVGRTRGFLPGFWLGILWTCALQGASPVETWQAPAGAVATDADLRGIAHGNGAFVVVGSHGTVLRSTDAEHWNVVDAGTDLDLTAVDWIDGQFVATDGSWTATSPEGLAWSAWSETAPPGALTEPNTTAYGDSYYVAVEPWFCRIRTSRNGVHWLMSQLNEPDCALFEIAYGSRRFVMVGLAGLIRLSDPVPPILDNQRPRLMPIPAQQTDEGGGWSFKATAEDPDPGDSLTFGLAPDAPAGMTIDAVSGLLAWNPREEDGPFVHRVGVWVHDAGDPALSDAQWFELTVREVNQAPAFRTLAGIVLDREMTVVIEASDDDSPLNGLGYELDFFPEGTLLDLSTRQYFWTPTAQQIGLVHTFAIRVSDDGSPRLGATAYLEVLALAGGRLTLEPAPLLRWQAVDAPTTQTVFRDLKFLEDRFVGVGEGGTIINSRDGVNWTRVETGFNVALNAVTNGGGMFLAAGEAGTVLTSRDGDAWSRVTLDGAPDLRLAAYGAGRFVVLGNGGSAVAFTSSDGTQWERQPPPAIPGGISDLIWTGDQFIAVGGGYSPGVIETRTVLRSQNGLDWVGDTRDGVPLRSLAQGHDRTVAVGANSYLWVSWGSSEVSRDGQTWTPRSLMNAREVAFGAGRFMALGVSTGKVWEYHSFLISRDGVFWREHPQPPNVAASLLAFGNGRFVALARTRDAPPANSRVLVSTSILDPEPRAALRVIGWLEGGFGLAVFGQNKVRYRIEISEDLLSWGEWKEVSGVFSGDWQTDPGAFSAPQRFYRLVTVP